MTLTEIAQKLGELYKERSQKTFADWQHTEDLKARKLYLTPAEGWQGKNAEQREVEAERTFDGDEPCRNMAREISYVKNSLSTIEGFILALEAERRALEWDIRGGLVEALLGKRNESNRNGVEQAFDDAGQATVDDELDKTLEEMNEHAVEFVEDDVPF